MPTHSLLALGAHRTMMWPGNKPLSNSLFAGVLFPHTKTRYVGEGQQSLNKVKVVLAAVVGRLVCLTNGYVEPSPTHDSLWGGIHNRLTRFSSGWDRKLPLQISLSS